MITTWKDKRILSMKTICIICGGCNLSITNNHLQQHIFDDIIACTTRIGILKYTVLLSITQA